MPSSNTSYLDINDSDYSHNSSFSLNEYSVSSYYLGSPDSPYYGGSLDSESFEINENGDRVYVINQGSSNTDSLELNEPVFLGNQIRGHQFQNYERKGTLLEITMSLHDNTCSICLEDLKIGKKGKILKCSHIYHPECIDK